MVGHGGSSAGSYLTDPTFPIPSLCTSIVATSTLRVKILFIRLQMMSRRTLKHSDFTNLVGIGSSALVAQDADSITSDTISEVKD